MLYSRCSIILISCVIFLFGCVAGPTKPDAGLESSPQEISSHKQEESAAPSEMGKSSPGQYAVIQSDDYSELQSMNRQTQTININLGLKVYRKTPP